jgi:predicted ATPase
MIEQWQLSNFKSIQAGISIPFAPLTIFVGQNSAGKSTLIQSILLTAQTLQSTVLNRGCILNGRVIKLGAFSDIRSNQTDEKSVTIGFTLTNSPFYRQSRELANPRYYYSPEVESEMRKISCSFSFSNGNGVKSLEMQPQLEAGSIFLESDEDGVPTAKFSYKRSQQSVDARLQRLGVLPKSVRQAELTTLDFELTDGDFPRSQRRAFRFPHALHPEGAILKHFLPVGASAAYDAVAFEVDAAFEMLFEPNQQFTYRHASEQLFFDLLKKEKFIEAITAIYREVIDSMTSFQKTRALERLNLLSQKRDYGSLRDFLASIPVGLRKILALKFAEKDEEIKGMLRGGRQKRMEISNFPASEHISFASDYVSSFFTENLKYLGPLRDEPKAIYPTGSSDPKDVGFKGEYTAAVLDNNKNTLVQYIPSVQFPVAQANQLKTTESELGHAVGDWLEYLGIAKKVESEDKGKLGHELTIATNSSAQLHDLTHVGVGVSQALPIVVLSLLAEKGSTLIFEQPELHLHPRVQSRLADFFMSLIFAGKQCVVETHSEYLISRLRLLSAKADGSLVSDNIGIFFVEKHGVQSAYRKVEVTQSGAINNWPSGFFDEAEQNASELIEAQILMAHSKVKNAGRKND